MSRSVETRSVSYLVRQAERCVRRGDAHWFAPTHRVRHLVESTVSTAASRARRGCGLRGRRVTALAVQGVGVWGVRVPGFRSAGSALRSLAHKSIGFLGAPPRACFSGGGHARGMWRERNTPAEMRLRRQLNDVRTARGWQ